jgi:hypothetical protein
MRFSFLALLAVVLLGGCAQTPRPARFSAPEQEVICAVTRGLALGGFASTVQWVSDSTEERRLAALGKDLAWRDLPRRMRCDRDKRELNRKGYGDFLNSFALSSDGSIAAIAGGFLYAPLLGGGGECYFERRETGWARIGCIHTWDS